MIAIPLLHYCVDVKSNMALYISLFQSEHFQISGGRLRKFLLRLSMGRRLRLERRSW